MNTIIPFSSVANEEWLLACAITGHDFGTGIPTGNEITFQHYRDHSESGGAFRFLPRDQIFMNHHEVGARMCLTPARFVSEMLSLPLTMVLKMFGSASNQRPDLSLAVPKVQTRLKKQRASRNLADLMLIQGYRQRVERLTSLFNLLEAGPTPTNTTASTWWTEKRNLSARSLRSATRRAAVVCSAADLDSAAAELGWNDGAKLASSLWRRANNGRVYVAWVSANRQILWPCWNVVCENGTHRMVVTGVRSRWTAMHKSNEPKEVAVSVKHCADHQHAPATLGLFGLLKSIIGDSPTQAQMQGCPNFTVVLCEGVIETFAGEELMAIEQPQLCPLLKSEIIFVSAGSIGCALWEENLRHIQNCKRLVIAFNDDSTRSQKNTGYDAAQRVAQRAKDIGISRVDIMSRACLEGVNDLNDLLRKRKAELASEPHPDWLRSRAFGNYIMGGISHGV
jgi:hypothetical protein